MYKEMMQTTDRRVSAIDLNGKHIIKDCKTIIVFLKEQLAKLKMSVQSTSFNNEAEEIIFFKRYKPMLLGQLIYFHEILRIENQSPFGEDELDAYYEKGQEEQKLFFDRHIAFFQYYPKCRRTSGLFSYGERCQGCNLRRHGGDNKSWAFTSVD